MPSRARARWATRARATLRLRRSSRRPYPNQPPSRDMGTRRRRQMRRRRCGDVSSSARDAHKRKRRSERGTLLTTLAQKLVPVLARPFTVDLRSLAILRIGMAALILVDLAD